LLGSRKLLWNLWYCVGLFLHACNSVPSVWGCADICHVTSCHVTWRIGTTVWRWHNNLLINFLIIKPTRYTSFSNLFWKWKSTCFGQFFCSSSGVIHCTLSNGMCHTGLQTAFEQDQDGTTSEIS
jgi:hypothetical protein